ncbi:SusE domain-containing protein [Olivibacter sitiensis]|uniref:SusE domain-containing protein n=1 Tax=Olivibacter sitiensis TaxID=376470 RepID=UPI00040C0A35|nr:SusF/SusE family outer membrane protein [Olivibacter sitiensis]
MKRYLKSWLALLFLLVGLGACKKDNLDALGQWEFTGPVLSSPAADTSIVLDNENPLANVRFQWEKAATSQRFNITYKVVLVHPDSTTVNDPWLSVSAANNGAARYANITNKVIDEALAAQGYEVNDEVPLKWGVVAEALGRQVFGFLPLTITRLEREEIPENLYIAGAATEVNTDVSNAIRMKPIRKQDGSGTGIFEIYTSLQTGGGFRFYAQRSAQGRVIGGSNGTIRNNGEAITVSESATYRIRIDLEANTYSLLKIDKWSIVGSVIADGWGGDEPLEYQGGGIWRSSVNLLDPAGEDARFIFRANGDWDLGMKRVESTANTVLMENAAEELGFALEDIPLTSFGRHIVTLDLSAEGYTYQIEQDNSVETPTTTPDRLFLIADGEAAVEFTKDGNRFTSPNFIPLQAGKPYYFSGSENGSGQRYTLSGTLGLADDLSADNVRGNVEFGVSDNPFQVNQDQAYNITVDFGEASLAWRFYNIKLFHWDDWEARRELRMNYVHPLQFALTADLNAGYNSKFISPWDVELSSPTPTAMEGQLTSDGQDIKATAESGSYVVRIVVNADFNGGTYQFEKQ